MQYPGLGRYRAQLVEGNSSAQLSSQIHIVRMSVTYYSPESQVGSLACCALAAVARAMVPTLKLKHGDGASVTDGAVGRTPPHQIAPVPALR